MLPYSDLVVCLDGRGGIAAACPPSDLSAALQDPARQSSSSSSIDRIDGTIERGTGTDIRQSGEGGVSRDVKNDENKPITRSESNGFFDLLSALPRMGNDVPSLRSSSSNDNMNIISKGNKSADDGSMQIIANQAGYHSFDMPPHLDSTKVVISAASDEIVGSDTISTTDTLEDIKGAISTTARGANKEMLDVHGSLDILKVMKKVVERDDLAKVHKEVGEDTVSREAVLLVEKEFKGSGTVGLRIYWFYFHSGGGVLAVLLLMTSNLFLPTAW